MKRYNPKELEPKWQKKWVAQDLYKASEDPKKRKRYVLEYFPYPSGAAMHVGHARNYTIGDAVARFYRMNGDNVLHPMGWDAFGLPAENYAIKTGVNPKITIKESTTKFKQQLTQLGFSYDWSREINSSNPMYYKWTQWFFKLLYDRGLAYQDTSLQWWCDFDKTVLANEQVENGRCWRCGNIVTKKPLKQWFFKITDYADRLQADLENLDWSDAIKSMQKNWIGKSTGAEVEFAVANSGNRDGELGNGNKITVFTTRIDTLFGATFMVLAPEHPLVQELTTKEQKQKVEDYIRQAETKTDISRMETDREKTGVFTGSYAINPMTHKKIPIWIADYVLMGYGTGAIMAVPAHDERDFEFASKFGLEIEEVILPYRVDTKNPPKPGKKFAKRRGIHGIVYNPKTDKYLCVQWKEFPWTAFIVGGVEDEDGDDVVKAARREIYEETGYKNLKFVSVLGSKVVSKYYAAHKDVNREALVNAVLFELIDEERDIPNAEEQAKHEPIWLTRVEITQDRMTCAELDLWLNRIDGKEIVYTGDGILIHSDEYTGMESAEAREKIIKDTTRLGFAKEKTQYKLRDWLISRQRYWGAPIPIIYCPDHGPVLVPDDQLPVKLPEVKDYQPKGDGKSVLASVDSWVNTKCPKCGKPAKRETDTMDGFACSSWYFLRFADPHNNKEPFDKTKVKYWLPVDDYIGGAEHAVMHLLYARFWTKVMYDAKLIDFDEPFTSLRNHGMILAPDGRKMSKSYNNTITPDELIEQGYGADSIRLMELFIGPWDQEVNWSVEGLGGVFRFLQRVWAITQKYLDAKKPKDNPEQEGVLLVAAHTAIKKVSADLKDMGFNTAISALMEFTNELYKIEAKDGFAAAKAWQFALETLTQLLAPFAPHIAEELWQQLGQKESIHISQWPVHDETYLIKDVVKIAVQVNGKLRGEIQVANDSDQEVVEQEAKLNQNVASYLKGDIKKVIYVKNKLINFVV